jgi:hypothetical protein
VVVLALSANNGDGATPFIDSLSGVDELWNLGRRLKVRNTLGLHDVLY